MAISIFLSLFLFLMFPEPTIPATLSITNNCPFPIWPGLLSGAGTSPLTTTGFLLPSGESRPIDVPPSWSGRLWGRTLCSTNPSTGHFSCATADCNSGTVSCSGSGATPPATLAEFTLNGSDGMDFFDVSLVDGYNLPLLVIPEGGRCGSTGCLVDVTEVCPPELLVVASGEAVACRSACEAFGSPEYCCSGEFGGARRWRGPSIYSQLFKNACPRAYSYAYDDATSTFTCSAGTDFAVTFCPSTTREVIRKAKRRRR
ncbi:thaumatin-like protein 1b isoform X2 [Phalaenopsis equestris]|uniref:thaumatin-like protein 1b isoform X2 n=1 Tax=Phalaenopsis equestris TaxID=78828 RepID=UPI0009E5E3F8|nr:thaumatin-like protein 1b isoform X2 [Phalaenopsis equestris]